MKLTDEEIDARFDRAWEIVGQAGDAWDADSEEVLGEVARKYVKKLPQADLELLAAEYIVHFLPQLYEGDDPAPPLLN